MSIERHLNVDDGRNEKIHKLTKIDTSTPVEEQVKDGLNVEHRIKLITGILTGTEVDDEGQKIAKMEMTPDEEVGLQEYLEKLHEWQTAHTKPEEREMREAA